MVVADSETAGSKFYVLRSLVPRNWRKKFIVDDDQSPSRHLLIVLLMLIKCHGDKLAEGISSAPCACSRNLHIWGQESFSMCSGRCSPEACI